ncbi:unnamed protein product [Calypogeia fissa]
MHLCPSRLLSRARVVGLVQRHCTEDCALKAAKARKSSSRLKLRPLFEKALEEEFCGNEAEVETLLVKRLFTSLERLLCKLGAYSSFRMRPPSVTLDPTGLGRAKLMKESTSMDEVGLTTDEEGATRSAVHLVDQSKDVLVF